MGKSSSSLGIIRVLTVLFAALCGAYLLIGGIWLTAIGGSWYYIISGIIMLIVAGLIWRRNSNALLLYALFLLGTMAWAVWSTLR